MVSFRFCRAIPEAGYITLGTIRYGVKLATGGKPLSCIRTSTISSCGDGESTLSSSATATAYRGANGRNGADRTNASDSNESNDSGDSVISDGCSCKQCCGCLDGTALLMPWKGNSCEKNAFEMVKRKVEDGATGRKINGNGAGTAGVDEAKINGE